jgi:CheY-like chemotaxis protein
MSAVVLVVEDNPDNMKLVTWALEDEGFDVVGVTSAEAALARLDQQAFDVVLMDISLPGMDGKEATRQLRQQPRFAHLPIIAVSAHAIAGEKEAILASGVSALVTKPIDEDVLMATIRAQLAAQEAEHG